ncbi:glucan 1,4-alpha-glucosidase [Luteitalea sp. TBR-22]|uniref:glucan 1,4-alpha-glucosidase n=1 Tax=Luteitalea sp. TBR-22 TaxID=2802971 RepID=UPI001EF5A57F|nr:glucan 1,4-alpha-glucosidase [Luteitalea sp. TBR-22]BCS35039.2 glucan 1,4-alpha-glucosidase [Luteitalea sp. TBR-22]
MSTVPRHAPGWPGIQPRWTTSAKSAVGTALRAGSKVWFTLSHGILNEVYYPRVDQACLRDLGLIVTDGSAGFSEEKRDTTNVTRWCDAGIPAFRLVNTCRDGRFRIEKAIVTDPRRDVLLQRVRFVPLVGAITDYRVHVLLAPHLANRGTGNTGVVGEFKGVRMLTAERDGAALAVACSKGWLRVSAGFVGRSDGWLDLATHRHLAWEYDRAENGNVALVGEVDLVGSDGQFVIALAFGSTVSEAAHGARASLFSSFDDAWDGYVAEWREWQHHIAPPQVERSPTCRLTRISATVLRCHEEKRLPGAMIASLSIPWGADKGDDDLGGYHLVWPRDLVEAAGGLLAAGARTDALRALQYLRVVQNPDGSWPQNMWVDGTPYWRGIQLDETALPILLVDLLQRHGDAQDLVATFWPMIRQAVSYIVTQGPVTEQDRWEEEPGFAPFTVAVQIAALIVAADIAGQLGEPETATYLCEIADGWNDTIDEALYVEGTALAAAIGVAGYYVKIAPPEPLDTASQAGQSGPDDDGHARPRERRRETVSPDALALVRFGLRAADDPRIVDTIRAIDSLLKVDTPHGPVWRRYNGDRYGEQEDGTAYSGTGIGRGWPLLTGERAHYEIAAGRFDEAAALMSSIERFAGDTGLIPEQVWDEADVPERELRFGGPTGSAMPLVWAHAEYLKLQRSINDQRIFDMPSRVRERYVTNRTRSRRACWRFNHRRRRLAQGLDLRIETLAATTVHWSTDGWATVHDTPSRDTLLGVHVTDLPAADLPAGAEILFTFFWTTADRWEQRDFQVTVSPSAQCRPDQRDGLETPSSTAAGEVCRPPLVPTGAADATDRAATRARPGRH